MALSQDIHKILGLIDTKIVPDLGQVRTLVANEPLILLELQKLNQSAVAQIAILNRIAESLDPQVVGIEVVPGEPSEHS